MKKNKTTEVFNIDYKVLHFVCSPYLYVLPFVFWIISSFLQL